MGKYSDTTITLSEILFNKELLAELPNCNLKMNYEIVSYSLIIISAKNDTIIEKIKIYGKTLPLSKIKFIENLKSRDKLIFEEIRINGPHDMYLKPFYIMVK